MSRPPVEKNNEDLLRDLDEWLAARGGTASLRDVLATRNHLLFAAFILRGFRKAAREAVFDRFRYEALAHEFSGDAASPGALFFMVDKVGEAWSLAIDEKVNLLGLATAEEWEALRHGPIQDISPETLERAAILLDIFSALAVLLPKPEAADRWVRAANSAATFGGNSVLEFMLKGGLNALRSLRTNLRAQAAGN